MSHKHQFTPDHPETPDSWHLHTTREGPPQAEHGGKVNTLLLGVGLVASVVFVGMVILVTFLYFQTHMTSKRQQLIESTALSATHHQYRDQASASLRDYSFFGEAAARAGVVSIPIDQAKQNVITRYSGRNVGQK